MPIKSIARLAIGGLANAQLSEFHHSRERVFRRSWNFGQPRPRRSGNSVSERDADGECRPKPRPTTIFRNALESEKEDGLRTQRSAFGWILRGPGKARRTLRGHRQARASSAQPRPEPGPGRKWCVMLPMSGQEKRSQSGSTSITGVYVRSGRSTLPSAACGKRAT